MPRLSEHDRTEDVVPLQSAVLCVDCESVTSSRCDQCPRCGSRSIFNLLRTLGGAITGQTAKLGTEGGGLVKFDLEITINLQEMEPRDVNGAVESIALLIAPKLAHGRASFHIRVEPRGERAAKAA